MVMAEETIEMKLYCPSMAKLVPYVASNSDRIDLGSIARVFGLHPATLRLNGHFLGSGPDWVASSVSWNSLITFFSGRGLPTGSHERSPLLVHGKILKPGNKRSHEPPGGELMMYSMDNPVSGDSSGRMQNARVGLSKKRKLADSGTQRPHGDGLSTANKTCNKRKFYLLENLTLMKKLKIDETKSSKLYEGQSSSSHYLFSKPLKNHFPCSYMDQKIKRTREEETVVDLTPERFK